MYYYMTVKYIVCKILKQQNPIKYKHVDVCNCATYKHCKLKDSNYINNNENNKKERMYFSFW